MYDQKIWGLYRGQGRLAGAVSLALHAAAIGLLILAGASGPIRALVTPQIALIAPDLTPYKRVMAPQKEGGGGGGRSPAPPTRGELPKLACRQFVPPLAVVRNENPRLVMEPALVIQPDENIPKVDVDILGDPVAKSGPASSGPGTGGGVGVGRSDNVGPGLGPGFGPGSGGYVGGGPYRIGGGVSAPTVLFQVEPKYSEEARAAKFQGTVLIFVVVDEHGYPRDLKVIRPVGFGLDQKALEAVTLWRFHPGIKDGKPVAVQATTEVTFRLL